MTKEYITITILDFTDLNIDGSSKADLRCLVYCNAWGDVPHQSKVIKNALEANFNVTYQVPINHIKDVIDIEISDESNNLRTLSSISIPVVLMPYCSGQKVFDLEPKEGVINGGKLKIEYRRKDEFLSEIIEKPIQPHLSFNPDSESSFISGEKKASKKKDRKQAAPAAAEPNDQEFDYDYYYYYTTGPQQKRKSKPAATKPNDQEFDYDYYYSTTGPPQPGKHYSTTKPEDDEYDVYFTTTEQPAAPAPFVANSKDDEYYDYN